MTIIASHFSSMYETDPKQNWADVEERIMNLKWKGEFATSISRDTQTYVENALKGIRSEELYSLIKSNAVSKIENLLSMILVKPLGDKNIHMELSWDNASAEQIQTAKQERELRDTSDGSQVDDSFSPQQEPDDKINVDDGSVILEVDFVLAPVSGIPIFELQPGDRIMVKINPATKRGMYFIELLNAKHDEEIVPVPATVTEIKLNKSNEYIVIVKIGEGIFEKSSRLKTSRSNVLIPTPTKKPQPMPSVIWPRPVLPKLNRSPSRTRPSATSTG